jgi:hypothetical protein
MLNQTQFGTPQGAGNFLAPVEGLANKFFDRKRTDRGDLRKMVVGHELQSIRDEKKMAHQRGSQESAQAHAVGMQTRGIEHAASEGKASRSHERRMAKLRQEHEATTQRTAIAGDVLKSNAAFAGVAGLGKGKRVSNFSMDGQGGMTVNFNKPTTRRRSSTTPGQPTQVEPTTPQRSTTAPDVTPGTSTATTPVPPVTRDPKTGRAMRNPAYSSPTPAAKKTPSAGRKKK